MSGHKGVPRTEEEKRKISLGNKGKVRSQEVKDRIRQTLKSHPIQYTEEYRQIRRDKMIGNKYSCRTPETATDKRKAADKLHSQRMKGRHLHKHTDETRALLSVIVKTAWLDPEFKDKAVGALMKGRQIKPNKQEAKLETLLSLQFPNEWKFVGDGQLIIGGTCPDFTNINGKKALIEYYGSHWHGNDNPQERIDHFAKYGYKCLVVWEPELKDTSKLIIKIKECFYV